MDIVHEMPGQGIEVGDGRDETREFCRLHILLWSRVGLVVEEKGVDWGFQIYGEVQEGRHGVHYEIRKWSGSSKRTTMEPIFSMIWKGPNFL